MYSNQSQETGQGKPVAVDVLCSILVVTPLGGCSTTASAFCYEKRTLCRTYQADQKGYSSLDTDVRSDPSALSGTDIHNKESIIDAAWFRSVGSAR